MTIQEPRSLSPRKSKQKKQQIKRRLTRRIRKSRSVIIQIPKKSRNVKIQTPEPEELRSGYDTLTPQRLASVAGQPYNRLYIVSGPLYTSSSTKSYWEVL